MSKEDHGFDDEPVSVIERHPRSKFSLLPIIILFFAFLLYGVVTSYNEIEQVEQKTVMSHESTDSNNSQGKGNKLSLHQLVASSDVKGIAENIYTLDKVTINSVVNGMTPIMLAASHGNVDIIDLLFTQGADPNKRGAMQRTALQYAVEKNHIEAAQRLLDYGADIDAYDNGQLTPLVMAASRNYTELGLLFIEKGADVNIQHVEGWTALIDAAAHNNEKLVIALLEAGADKNLKAKNGKKAIDYAKEYGFPNMVKILSK